MSTTADQNKIEIHSGWLLKLGKLNKSWKRRYFKLYSDGAMDYFIKDNDQKPKGTINILQISQLELLQYKPPSTKKSKFSIPSSSVSNISQNQLIDTHIPIAMNNQPSKPSKVTLSTTNDDNDKKEESSRDNLSRDMCLSISSQTSVDDGAIIPTTSLTLSSQTSFDSVSHTISSRNDTSSISVPPFKHHLPLIPTNKECNQPFAFSLSQANRDWRLCAGSKQEFQEWVNILTNNKPKLSRTPSPPQSKSSKVESVEAVINENKEIEVQTNVNNNNDDNEDNDADDEDEEDHVVMTKMPSLHRRDRISKHTRSHSDGYKPESLGQFSVDDAFKKTKHERSKSTLVTDKSTSPKTDWIQRCYQKLNKL